MLGLFPCAAVTERVIGISLERDVRIVPLHPRIEGIVQEQVRQQRAGDSALRRAALPRLQAPVRHLHRDPEPALDVEQHPLIVSVMTHRAHQQVMIDVIEEPFDVEVHDPVVAPAALARLPHRLMC